MTNDDMKKIALLCAAYHAETDHARERIHRADIANAIPKTHVESLRQLADRGPIHDGDVISKATRDTLLQWKLAVRVLVKGEWGYTACTYLGGHILTAIEELGIAVKA